MTNQYRYFMIAAEEKNLKRAADRAYISHQGMSNAIRQLENTLGVVLFNRQPKLSLTPEGEVLARAVKEIQLIEENMMREFAENGRDYKISLNLGIEACWYSALTPLIVSPFKEMYPNATLNIVSDFNEKMEQSTITTDLDFYIGNSASQPDVLKAVPLAEENYYCLISRHLLQKFFPQEWQQMLTVRETPVSFKKFAHIPIIMFPFPSVFGRKVSSFAESNGIILDTAFECNKMELFPTLCYHNLGSAIISDISGVNLRMLRDQNNTSFPANPFYAFRLKPLSDTPNYLSLFYHKQKYMTQCHKALIQLVTDTFQTLKFAHN